MKATVVTNFKDSVSGKFYRVGDNFSLENVEQERIDLLKKPHPKTNKIYLYVEGEQETSNEGAEGEKQESEKQKADEQKQEPSNDGATTGESKEDAAQITEEEKPKTTRKRTKPEPSNEGE